MFESTCSGFLVCKRFRVIRIKKNMFFVRIVSLQVFQKVISILNHIFKANHKIVVDRTWTARECLRCPVTVVFQFLPWRTDDETKNKTIWTTIWYTLEVKVSLRSWVGRLQSIFKECWLYIVKFIAFCAKLGFCFDWRVCPLPPLGEIRVAPPAWSQADDSQVDSRTGNGILRCLWERR